MIPSRRTLWSPYSNDGGREIDKATPGTPKVAEGEVRCGRDDERDTNGGMRSNRLRRRGDGLIARQKSMVV